MIIGEVQRLQYPQTAQRDDGGLSLSDMGLVAVPGSIPTRNRMPECDSLLPIQPPRHGNCRSRFHYTDPLGLRPRELPPLSIPLKQPHRTLQGRYAHATDQ